MQLLGRRTLMTASRTSRTSVMLMASRLPSQWAAAKKTSISTRLLMIRMKQRGECDLLLFRAQPHLVQVRWPVSPLSIDYFMVNAHAELLDSLIGLVMLVNASAGDKRFVVFHKVERPLQFR